MKKEEIKILSLLEIEAKILEFKSKYNSLKLQNSMSRLDNPMIIKNLRRDIARLSTEKNIKLVK